MPTARITLVYTALLCAYDINIGNPSYQSYLSLCLGKVSVMVHDVAFIATGAFKWVHPDRANETP